MRKRQPVLRPRKKQHFDEMIARERPRAASGGFDRHGNSTQSPSFIKRSTLLIEQGREKRWNPQKQTSLIRPFYETDTGLSGSCSPAGCPLFAEEPPPLALKISIPLPNVEGRFDHAAADPETHRLFFVALGNNTLEIVDLSAGKRLHTITGLKKPTGVLFLADLNLLIAANGDDGTCGFYDGMSCMRNAGASLGLDDADQPALRLESQARLCGLWRGALGVIDPVTMRLTGSIRLKNHPESFQLEYDGPRIFVNVPDAKQIAVVDGVAGKVLATWPLEDVRANFPMALDEKQHRLFVGCRQPARLLVDTQAESVSPRRR
jgi:hypothetical protein